MIAQCSTAYALLRAEPRHAAELTSQLVLGELVVVDALVGDWMKVSTEHGYQGFTRTAQFTPVSPGTAFPEGLYRINGSLNSRISDLPVTALRGSLLWKATQSLAPLIPVPEDAEEITHPNPFQPELLARQARTYLGVPYVWGGKTETGLDCSGLVQVLVQQQGYSFPRDAWQQSERGAEVKTNGIFTNLLPGDLLFFQHPGKRIHHVAVSLGGPNYIHSSEWVRINSLHPDSPLYQPERAASFCLAKRLGPDGLLPVYQSFRDLWATGQNKKPSPNFT